MRIALRWVVVLATMLALLSPGATSVLAAGISVNPTTGAIGTTTSVSGNGFAASTTVRVLFNGSGGTQIGQESTDGSGNLPALNVNIPNVTAGTYQIFATDNTNTATTTFTVPSSLTLSPASGGAGTSVSVTGAGFLSGETISITWDQGNNQVASTSGNANGGFTTSFTVPSSSGTHTVFAVGHSSHFALSAVFMVSGNVGNASLTANPTSGAAGSVVGLTGSGYTASEHVNIAVDGHHVLSLTSDGSGNFTTNITLSSSLVMGGHTISATGVSSGNVAFATFSVTSTAQANACSSGEDEKPGNGEGDDNHCHTGPPGHQQGDQNDDGNGNGHGHGNGNHGDGNDQGEDD